MPTPWSARASAAGSLATTSGGASRPPSAPRSSSTLLTICGPARNARLSGGGSSSPLCSATCATMKRLLWCLALWPVLAAPALADDDDEKIQTMIRRLAADQKLELRRQAASDLARLGPAAKPALKALMRAMQKDTDSKVRAYAV